MKSKNLFTITLLFALSAAACGGEISPESSFEDLCLASGGELSTSSDLGQDVTGNYCKCPRIIDETGQAESFDICREGVVCKPDESSNGFVCAGDGHSLVMTVECSTKDEVKCENGAIYTCNGKNWGEGKPCAKNASCQSKTECGECQNGDQRCDDDNGTAKLERCQEGQWVDSDNHCAWSCNAAHNGCGECINQTQKCEDRDENGSQEFVCENGAWVQSQDCKEVSCNSDQCGECINGIITCREGTYKVCANGTWTSPEDEITCGETCEESTRICKDEERIINNTPTMVGMQKYCYQGRLINEKYCNNNSKCTDENQCPEDCEDGQTQCSNNEIQTCKDGVWQTQKKCTNMVCAVIDNVASCHKANELNSYRRCNQNAIEKWNSDINQWEFVESCDDRGCNENASYSPDIQCYECKNGTTQCNGTKVQTCSKHSWLPAQDCWMGQCTNNKCPACSTARSSCIADKLAICANHEWTSISQCTHQGAPVSCQNSYICGTCKNGQRGEVDDYLGLKRFKTCKTGTYDNSDWEYCNYGETNYTNCSTYNVHVRMIPTNVSSLKIRSKPDTTTENNVISYFSTGEEAIVYGQKQVSNHTWFLIKFQNGAAWIGSGSNIRDSSAYNANTSYTDFKGTLSYYKTTRLEQSGVVKNSSDGYTNVRSHPSYSSSLNIIGQYKPGNKLEIYGNNPNWYETIYEDQIAWIYREQVDVSP